MACYSGPNPVTDDERYAIWKWAKANGIDHGLPFDKIHDAINNHFFAGQARPEWINDILSGRKTPFRSVANDVWRAQYNRRVITQQAKDLYQTQSMGPIGRALRTVWNFPRGVSVGQFFGIDLGHGLVFPLTHAGDLAFRPENWSTFFKGAFNTWTKSWSPAAAERMMDNMQRQPLFETALRSGLDVGPRSHPVGLMNMTRGASARAWDMLTTMRYDLWNNEMQKYIRPDMTQAQVLDVGKNLAEWANHATGSGKGPISSLGGNVLFGPKLTQSKLNRLFSDPAKTIKTFANWNNASVGEKAAAWTRLSGATQYLATGLGMLAVNQGLLMATNQKQKVNFTDPTKSDFLAFKGGGLEWSIPGMHSEIRTLGQVLATSFMTNKQLKGDSRYSHMAQILGQYALGKATPAIGRGAEVAFGQNFMGRPVPWSSNPGTKSKPRMSWGEYAGTIGPIPLEGPIRYFYDQMRQNGSSVTDAAAITKGLIIFGMGATGLHASQDYSQQAKAPLRIRNERTQIAR